MTDISKEIGIILRIHGKESNPKNRSIPRTYRTLPRPITSPYDIVNTFNNYFASIAETMKKSIKNIHINIFQTIFQMKLVVQYFCNLPIRKK